MHDDDLAREIIVTCARFTRAVRHRSETDESLATWRALAILSEHGPLRVGEFAAYDRLTQPTATAMMRRLVDDGSVRRTPDPRDGRAALHELTAAGRARLTHLREVGSAAITPLLNDLRPGEREELAAAMATLTRLLATTDERTPTA